MKLQSHVYVWRSIVEIRHQNNPKYQVLVAIRGALRFPYRLRMRKGEVRRCVLPEHALRCWSTPASTPPRRLSLNPIGRLRFIKLCGGSHILCWKWRSSDQCVGLQMVFLQRPVINLSDSHDMVHWHVQLRLKEWSLAFTAGLSRCSQGLYWGYLTIFAHF